MEYREKSLEIIQPYLNQSVESTLDGSLFDHVPGTFKFRFEDPSTLWERLQDDYEDYLEDWDSENIIPVAAVSSKDSPDYEFAWVFLNWSDEKPGVIITTTDDWGKERTLDSLSELKLKIK